MHCFLRPGPSYSDTPQPSSPLSLSLSPNPITANAPFSSYVSPQVGDIWGPGNPEVSKTESMPAAALPQPNRETALAPAPPPPNCAHTSQFKTTTYFRKRLSSVSEIRAGVHTTYRCDLCDSAPLTALAVHLLQFLREVAQSVQ